MKKSLRIFEYICQILKIVLDEFSSRGTISRLQAGPAFSVQSGRRAGMFSEALLAPGGGLSESGRKHMISLKAWI